MHVTINVHFSSIMVSVAGKPIRLLKDLKKSQAQFFLSIDLLSNFAGEASKIKTELKNQEAS